MNLDQQDELLRVICQNIPVSTSKKNLIFLIRKLVAELDLTLVYADGYYEALKRAVGENDKMCLKVKTILEHTRKRFLNHYEI